MELLAFYSDAYSYGCCASYGEGDGQIWLDGFNCPSWATSFEDCEAFTWGSHDCAHREDAGVACVSGELDVSFVLTTIHY